MSEPFAFLTLNLGPATAAFAPHRDRWGVTLADPDGYRLVLSSRAWP